LGKALSLEKTRSVSRAAGAHRLTGQTMEAVCRSVQSCSGVAGGTISQSRQDRTAKISARRGFSDIVSV